MKWEPWSKSAQICGRFKSSAQIGRYSVGVGATKVWRFYVSATSATNVALVWHQKGGLTRFLDDLSIMHLMYVYIHESSEIKFLLALTLSSSYSILTPVPQSGALF